MNFDIVLVGVIIVLFFLFAMFVVQKFAVINEKVSQLNTSTKDNLENINNNLETKLEKVRHTVDEKLQENLQKRFAESFKLVTDRLDNFNKGLGEMQNFTTLATDLKRVMSNVKSRGTWAEVQLGAILENILTPTQYEKNAKVKPNSREIVEFAINIPNDSNENGIALLPIDSKFPIESYERLALAAEQGNQEEVSKYSKEIETFIKKSASEITKYIAPPYTTDFAIMFLPTEGLYAEVIKNAGLISEIQQKYRVIITGPMTITALINSLQMSFRSHALQKNAKEVWKLFAQIKQDLSSHQELLDKAKGKLYDATNAIDNIGERSRILSNKLAKIESLEE